MNLKAVEESRKLLPSLSSKLSTVLSTLLVSYDAILTELIKAIKERDRYKAALERIVKNPGFDGEVIDLAQGALKEER